MADVLEMLEQMRELRNRTYKQLGDVSEEQMLAPTSYGDRSVNVRFMFYRLIAHEVEHTVHLVKTLNALHVAQGEAGLILKNLQAARGEIEGMLHGLTEEDLDRVPAEGEWSPREVVQHIMDTEESYAGKIEAALQ